MANWSGTYTISAGAIGASSGSNTSTTFNNTGATWPTGAQSLANFTVRILTGTGAGQERYITSNTATQLTVPAWTTIPDTTSTYEIVLIFKNNDHLTGSVVLSSNITTELQDSATILVDGIYLLSIINNCTVRWQKTETTLVTWQANNREAQGTHGFWSYIELAASVAVAPQIQYIRILDASIGLLIRPSVGVGSGSTIQKIWIEGTSSQSLGVGGAALPVSLTLSKFFIRNCRTATLTYVTTSSPGLAQIEERIWCENCTTAGPSFSVVPTQAIRDSVFKRAWSNRNVNLNSGVTASVQDSYIKASIEAAVVAGGLNTLDAGVHILTRNVILGAQVAFGSTGVGTGTLQVSFNDLEGREGLATRHIDIGAATFYTASSSDNDYLAGSNGAVRANIDTSAATDSTATPSQYRNLTTARTNPKSIKNRPDEVDNVVVGTPTGDQVTITFDCANGVVSGQGETTVNSDSASGQTVLNVASVVGFQVGEIVEIGYGTARFETIRIASIGAGTLTGETNLVFTHTAAQADAVTKRLRHWGLPHVLYGSTSGNYEQCSAIPPVDDWGLIFTEIQTTFDGEVFAWKQVGHSITLANLESNTTYYARPAYYTPLGELVVGDEFSFSTTISDLYTDPGVSNVRLGTTYQFASGTDNRTGTARIPATSDVKVGVLFDASDSLTGTYDGSDRWTDPGDANVRAAVAYKANSLTNNQTGRIDVPTAGEVAIDVAFETDSATIGTYAATERYTDVSEAVVSDGYPYAYNSLTDNRTGTFITPSALQIADAVWDENLSLHTTAGSAGLLITRVYKRINTIISLLISRI